MASNGDDPMVKNRSMLKDFITTVATMSGDLSNITAPPFVLASKSTVEVPAYWAENPTIFCSPSTSEDPAERAMLVLRTFLAGIKSQCYMGQAEDQGLKKPLNAFLGELFLAKWEDDQGTTQMVSEQVSHHPPITACKIWNEKHGVITDSFNRSSITFSTSVTVGSTGVVLKTLTKYNEHYLLPIPSFKVKNLLSTPSPELSGTYYIPSTSGYMSVVHFSESGMFNSTAKHSVEAHVYKETESESSPIYTIKGCWNDKLVIHDILNGKDVETFNIQKQAIDAATKPTIEPVDSQDAWESRNAWRDVLTALEQGDMKSVSTAKDKVEEGQRQMRKDEEAAGGKKFEHLFFEPIDSHPVINDLAAKIPKDDSRDVIVQGETVWQMNEERWKTLKRPYHGGLRPDNTRAAAAAEDKSQTHQHDEKIAPSKPKSQPDNDAAKNDEIDPKLGTVEDGRKPNADGLMIDVGRQPEQKHIEGITLDQPGPQAAQTSVREEHLGSGIEGMSIDEKRNVEDMLRDKYSSGHKSKK